MTRALILAALVTGVAPVAAADPWAVRHDGEARGRRLLEALFKAPDSDEGLQALVDEVGLDRATRWAAERGRALRSWQAAFVEGRLWARRGREAAALAAFRRALAAGRTAPSLLGWVGEELVHLGREKEALALLRDLPRRPSKDAAALELVVRLALARRDLKLAVAGQRRLVEFAPREVQPRLHLARLLEAAGTIDEAVTELEGALKVVGRDGALRCQVLRDLGGIEEQLERFDEAVRHYEEALRYATAGEWAHRELEQRILKNYERRGAFVELSRAALRMLKGNPKNLAALQVLARRSVEEGKLEPAAGYYLRYLAQAPGDGLARSRLMLLLVRLGRPSEAAAQALELARREPSEPRHLLEHAALLVAAGQLARAQRALRDGLARYRKDGDALELLAAALEQHGDGAGAKLAYAALLKLDDPSGRYRQRVTRQLFRAGRRKEALALWREHLGAGAGRVAYEEWVEWVLTVGAWLDGETRPAVLAITEAGLRRHPGHAGLHGLKRRISAALR
ncbi:MAG: tetratricopeptide repeat protein [Deltaproteobacteria bacterium]|nr:tetratricopeptide repeat protein [Deltaproteobacteria bacterium]